jgi:hypothetical protein
MKSFLATITAILALATIAAPALAMPADNGPKTTARAESSMPGPVTPADGTAAIVYVLIGAGGALTLGAGAYLGARVVAGRPARPNPN